MRRRLFHVEHPGPRLIHPADQLLTSGYAADRGRPSAVAPAPPSACALKLSGLAPHASGASWIGPSATGRVWDLHPHRPPAGGDRAPSDLSAQLLSQAVRCVPRGTSCAMPRRWRRPAPDFDRGRRGPLYCAASGAPFSVGGADSSRTLDAAAGGPGPGPSCVPRGTCRVMSCRLRLTWTRPSITGRRSRYCSRSGPPFCAAEPTCAPDTPHSCRESAGLTMARFTWNISGRVCPLKPCARPVPLLLPQRCAVLRG
jgi:hypothetical protein